MQRLCASAAAYIVALLLLAASTRPPRVSAQGNEQGFPAGWNGEARRPPMLYATLQENCIHAGLPGDNTTCALPPPSVAAAAAAGPQSTHLCRQCIHATFSFAVDARRVDEAAIALVYQRRDKFQRGILRGRAQHTFSLLTVLCAALRPGGTTTGPPSDATRKVYNNATKNFSASTVSG
jgi:hypothetical protein